MKITLYPKYLIRNLFVHGRAKFFKAGYKLLYPECGRQGMTPWQHYVIDGNRKGFGNGNQPSETFFFREGYELEYPDVKAAGVDPWRHYAEKGLAEGHDNGHHPRVDLFFAAGYLVMYPDVVKSKMDPWMHYVLHGRKEGRDNGLHPNEKQFFASGYLEMYPDVVKSKMDPWMHYVLHGRKEGRDNGLHPNDKQFFASGYLEMYPDVVKSKTDPWRHYVLYGKKEGRDNGLHPNEKQFSASGYLEMYPDVVKSKMEPWVHYVLFGKKEGRDSGLHSRPEPAIPVKLKATAAVKKDDAYSLMKIQTYKRAIDCHKVISFDIFDTLLIRPYLKPTDLFLHIEKQERKPGFAKARIEAEEEARRVEKYVGDITLDMIYKHIGDEFLPLRKREEFFELQVCQPHPVLKELYDYALKENKQIIVISDMYLSKQFLTKLLDKKGYHKFDRVFVSCNEHVSKGEGRLFQTVLDDLKCEPSEVLHIGDNPVSDGANADRYGIDHLIIEKVSEHLFKTNPKAALLSNVNADKFEISLYLGILAINSASAQEYLNEQMYFENLGYEYGGIVAYQFIKFIYEDCLKNNITDIAMISRDGYTLQRVFDLFNSKKLNSHYVYAPRYLCNLISCQYNPESDEQVDAFAGYYREALQSSKNDGVSHKYSYQENLKFIEDNKEEINSLAKEKKSEYLEYLSQFSYDSSRLAMVDLTTGWHTTQKFFETIYKEKEIIGYYWRSTSKEIYFNEKVYDRNSETCDLLAPNGAWDFMEFLITAPEFPVKDVVHGQPVYKNTDNVNEQFRVRIYPYISDGIMRFVKNVLEIFGNIDINVSPLVVAKWICTLYHNPTDVDKKFMLNIRRAGDVNHSKYSYMFDSWR